MKVPPKLEDVPSKVRKLLNVSEYVFTGHAKQRLEEREVTALEAISILRHGYRQPDRDRFNEFDQNGVRINRWSYTFEGNTLDERCLRVVVSFKEKDDFSELMLIITVIDLNSEV